jgi:hypothetical protein
MIRTLLAVSLMSICRVAVACPGASDCEHHAKSDADPAHCARKADLMGASCSYSTNMMAQRVLDEGEHYSFTGRLQPSKNALSSRVAAPFTMGPERGTYVVANEVIEELALDESTAHRLTLEGMVLEVEGVSYFVATGYRQPNS